MRNATINHALVFMLALAAHAAAQAPSAATKAVEGLWAYTTLKPQGNEEFALTGMFVFKDGKFVQQSINNGEPFEAQGAMAHAGTYREGRHGIELFAEQTISVSPDKTPPFSELGRTEHKLSVERFGETLVITFGSETVQTFRRLGNAEGEIYSLDGGMLALVDGRFVLVATRDDGVVTGCGTFEREGDYYTLEVLRWAEAQATKVSYRRNDTTTASFDGTQLTLSDGESFRVK